MRLLGRLLLFAVGGVLLYLSITSIMSNWNVIQSIGWDNFFSSDTWAAVKSILIQVFYALCALYAIFLGLKGKATFISFIAAVVLTVIVVSRTIDFVKSDTEKTVENIVNLILSFLMPVGFSLGVVFLLIGENKREKK